MEIPKTYNPKEAEEKWYPYWEDKKLFSPESNKSPDAPVFTMVIPPPNVTGYLHMGHALNHTLQDVLARWRRMRGDKVLWLPGTDHAGIATQMIVEKQLAQEGLNRREMGREKFLERVWSWKEHSGGAIQNQMRILGDSVDWSRERFTMDDGLSNSVKEVFVRLFDEGLIYRGEYMINWSPGLQTAISDLEVEMKPVNGRLYHIAYPLDHNVDSAMIGLSELYEEQNRGEGGEAKSGILRTKLGDFLVVATTRPETMLGDTAIALNPEDTRYKGITSRKAILPLVGRELSFIEDAIVEKDFGTGFVKVTPAHDPNDFAMGQRHNLEFIQVIGKDAKISDNAPEKYRGLDRVEARKLIVADLDNLGLLLKVENYNHNVGHCQRSGTIVEPLITTQWFLKMESLAKPALEAVKDGRTKFIPESMTVIYNNWLENIRDWCISRQLWWGHRIPAWYTNDGTMIVARDETEARQRLADRGGDVNATLTQDLDVLDTWFSSALWPFSTLGWPDNTDDLKKYYPTTTLVTAADIIFFWVARMMMMGLKFMGEVPFSTVYINALVLDPEGKKMSKTKGNVVDPLVVFDKYGTDAARFTLTAASTAGLTLTLQETKLESARNFANKIWNATRFVLMNCDDVLLQANQADQERATIIDLGETPELADQWIFYRLNTTANEVDTALSEYKFHEAADLLYKYFWNDFCDWYIELSKPFVTSKDSSPRTIAVKRRIIFILERSLRLLHPIMPYITEELWQRLPHKGESISMSNYIDNTSVKLDDNAEREMNFVIEIITKLRNIRSTFNIAPSVSLRAQIAPMSVEARKIINREEEHIKRLARIEILEIQDTIANEHGSARAVISGATIAIPLEGFIDFEKEKARLDKELTKLASEREGLEKRLSSADFINRAAPDVVELTRNRSSEIIDQIEKLKVMRSAL